jgi:hypothetical protein
MYYETKLKPIVDEKYAEYLEETPKEHQQNRIAFAAVLVAKLFEQETPEIKAEVEAYIEKHFANKNIRLQDEPRGEFDTEEQLKADQENKEIQR